MIFGRAVKAITSPGVRSPWFQNAIEERQCKNRSTKKKPTIKNARHPFFCKTPFLKIRLKIKFWLIFECPMKIQVLFLLIPFKD